MAFEEVRIGQCRLICGDAREVVPMLGPVDAIVTDPPYGIGGDIPIAPTKPSRPSTYLHLKKYEYFSWDTKPDKAMIALMLQRSQYQIIWGGNYFAHWLPPSRGWLFWDKLFDHTTNFSHGELAWTSLDQRLKKLTCSSKAETNGGEDRAHPTQKPVAVMRWCLQQLPPACHRICDPYAGVGSTGVACVEQSKAFIGIEREPAYFEVMCRRIEEAYQQMTLFPVVARCVEPQQVSLFATVGGA